MNQRAITYRRLNNIPAEWGTAVNVQSMVYGNMGNDCATGVAFTRDPSTGEDYFYGEYLVITSYSIHYTKLYETDQKAAKGEPAHEGGGNDADGRHRRAEGQSKVFGPENLVDQCAKPGEGK